MARRLDSGDPSQLGSSCVDGGVNFAVYSEQATGLELCVFDLADRETMRLPFRERTGHVWHGFLRGAEAGLRYGLRAHGVLDPSNGLYFDASRLLIDPYARLLSGAYVQHPSHFPDTSADNAPYTPRSVVVKRRGTPSVTPTVRPFVESRLSKGGAALIYEAHVRGLTKLCEAVPAPLRGTYAGLAHPWLIRHLKRLGVTVVELLPVQYHLDEPHLVSKGLTNYWGYNPIALMAPHDAYASCAPRALQELAGAVRAFHDAGIEVVLDVVFNHTAEGGADGPVLSMRGLDNLTYYLFRDGEFVNFTGCGNTLNVAHPAVQRLVVDSLHYWVEALDVDGFRFDLAVTLGRDGEQFSARDGLLARIAADPLLSSRQLIAEPWDVGPNGYQLGAFAAPWREWNDRFRDTVRAYWRGDYGAQADLGRRLHGSSELFEHDGRTPAAGINFVTAHDGFVLHDLVSYSHKHNQANGEDNRDGHSHNLSDNMGHEGESFDQVLLHARERRKRAMLATLFLAQGTPMLLGGDEIDNSQQGNNNAYCQDNPLGWLKWNGDQLLVEFISRLSGLRAVSDPIWQQQFVHRAWVAEADSDDGDEPSLAWLRADGADMSDADWLAEDCSFALLRAGESGVEMCCFNRSPDPVPFQLPEPFRTWECRFDSSAMDGVPKSATVEIQVVVEAQSVVVLHSGME